MEKNFSGLEHVGDIVAAFPGASNIFKQYKIDFCCGGDQPLLHVLAEKGMKEEQIINQLNIAYEVDQKRRSDQTIDWRKASSYDLVNHIINTHHAFLIKELPLLSEYVTRILRVHGASHGDILSKLHRLFHTMKTELEHHLIAEETTVFPLIVEHERESTADKLQTVVEAIAEAEADHSDVGDILKEMRAVTNNYEMPEDACPTYMLTFRKLEELEDDLFQHIHLENNILFPRTA